MKGIIIITFLPSRTNDLTISVLPTPAPASIKVIRPISLSNCHLILPRYSFFLMWYVLVFLDSLINVGFSMLSMDEYNSCRFISSWAMFNLILKPCCVFRRLTAQTSISLLWRLAVIQSDCNSLSLMALEQIIRKYLYPCSRPYILTSVFARRQRSKCL